MKRGEETTRVTEVKGLATEDMVRFGRTIVLATRWLM